MHTSVRVYKYNQHSPAPFRIGDEIITRSNGRIVTHERVTDFIKIPGTDRITHFIVQVTRPHATIH